jgi:hypothetical protein
MTRNHSRREAPPAWVDAPGSRHSQAEAPRSLAQVDALSSRRPKAEAPRSLAQVDALSSRRPKAEAPRSLAQVDALSSRRPKAEEVGRHTREDSGCREAEGDSSHTQGDKRHTQEEAHSTRGTPCGYECSRTAPSGNLIRNRCVLT